MVPSIPGETLEVSKLLWHFRTERDAGDSDRALSKLSRTVRNVFLFWLEILVLAAKYQEVFKWRR